MSVRLRWLRAPPGPGSQPVRTQGPSPQFPVHGAAIPAAGGTALRSEPAGLAGRPRHSAPQLSIKPAAVAGLSAQCAVRCPRSAPRLQEPDPLRGCGYTRRCARPERPRGSPQRRAAGRRVRPAGPVPSARALPAPRFPQPRFPQPGPFPLPGAGSLSPAGCPIPGSPIPGSLIPGFLRPGRSFPGPPFPVPSGQAVPGSPFPAPRGARRSRRFPSAP